MFKTIEPLEGKKIRIIGKRQEKYIGQVCEGSNCNFTYHDEELIRDVICIECEGKKYELTLFQTYGECGSGWTTASFGQYSLEEVEEFTGMTYKCVVETPIIVVEYNGDSILCSTESLKSCESGVVYDEDWSNLIFSVDNYGIDPYYPAGGYTVSDKYFKEIEKEETQEAQTDEPTEEEIERATKEFLMFFRESQKRTPIYSRVIPKIMMKDGEYMSVQASSTHYCSPRTDNCSRYDRYEIGFPSQLFDEIRDFAETPNTTDTVFGWVPEELIVKIIAEHGGIDFEKSFSKSQIEKMPEVREYIKKSQETNEQQTAVNLQSLRSQIASLKEQVEISLVALKKLQQLAESVGTEKDE